ncbi:methyl-accepting chemotaxis protein [Ideonella sp. DXS29W]|uniref:Methyl-accepting chemotaxis protein n=1 Tax=Ideonella lacteola TaxID=2984193 RepID=A0ABU9C2C2_9BURK
MDIRSVRIGARLGAGFALLISLLVLLGAVALHSLGAVQAGADTVYHDRVVPLQQLKQIADAYAVDVIDSVNKANAGLLNAKEAARHMRDARETIDKAWRAYLATELTEEESRLAKEAQALFGPANAAVDDVQRALMGMDGLVRGGLDTYDGPLYTTIDPISSKITELVDLQLRVAKEVNEASDARYKRTQGLVVGIVVGAALIAAGLAWTITRSVTQPLDGAIVLANEIRNGNLTNRVEPLGRDEATDLQEALADMQNSLQRIVRDVRNGVDSVTTASGQIAAGNLDLSQRTEQTASSLEETASSMEQIATTVRLSAEGAGQARDVAQRASEAARKGGDVVGGVVQTMDGITASSRRIADITGVIDGIAFQTNILALNAAVEAARAGEQGRGFAVVATEVRQLAQRSAVAAKEIKSLIAESVERIDNGGRQVAMAGQAIDEIVQQVDTVAALITQISTAVGEQSTGIGQVNQAVSEMDRVTQQNSALVEEGAAAAQSLAHQARVLSSTVASFRL